MTKLETWMYLSKQKRWFHLVFICLNLSIFVDAVGVVLLVGIGPQVCGGLAARLGWKKITIEDASYCDHVDYITRTTDFNHGKRLSCFSTFCFDKKNIRTVAFSNNLRKQCSLNDSKYGTKIGLNYRAPLLPWWWYLWTPLPSELDALSGSLFQSCVEVEARWRHASQPPVHLDHKNIVNYYLKYLNIGWM